MKLIYCQDCGDLVAPHRVEYRVRWCDCRRHAVWWRQSKLGLLSVFDSMRSGRPPELRHMVPLRTYVLAIHNDFIHASKPVISRNDYDDILAGTPAGHLYHQVGQICVRVRPGVAADVQLEDTLPS